MDDDVKQLKADAEKYRAAVDHLFTEAQWRAALSYQQSTDQNEAGALSMLNLPGVLANPNSKRDFQAALMESHFVFPNLNLEARWLFAGMIFIGRLYRDALSAESRAPDGVKKFAFVRDLLREHERELTAKAEPLFCKVRDIYAKATAKDKLPDLQRRYVEQVILAVEFPE